MIDIFLTGLAGGCYGFSEMSRKPVRVSLWDRRPDSRGAK